MNRAKKSFAAPTAKPCDVEYRLRRLQERMTDTLMFLRSIDPSVYPADYAAVATALDAASATVFAWKAPAKKARRSDEEKAQAAAAKQLAKEQAAAAKKAVTKSKKEPKVKAEPKADVVVAKPANSAIERALAAAKARKAVKASLQATA